MKTPVLPRVQRGKFTGIRSCYRERYTCIFFLFPPGSRDQFQKYYREYRGASFDEDSDSDESGDESSESESEGAEEEEEEGGAADQGRSVGVSSAKRKTELDEYLMEIEGTLRVRMPENWFSSPIFGSHI